MTAGLAESAGGTFGGVGTEAVVGPADGASSTPGAREPPHAARASAAIRAPPAVSTRLGIERVRLAKVASRASNGAGPAVINQLGGDSL